MNTFFTADTHFGHANIIKYCKRPQYSSEDFDEEGQWRSSTIRRLRAQDMDAMLVSNWNSVVTNEDTVYHLGDFSFGSVHQTINYLCEIRFKRFYFIWGNHDSAMRGLYQQFKSHKAPAYLMNRVFFLGHLEEVRIGYDVNITLCHYAMKVWNKSHAGTWHLYGHSHGSLPDDPHSRSLDVGVDVHGYRPISLEEVSMYMAKKTFVPIDHHGE